MSTLLRQRSNYVWNPRGAVESNTLEDRRTNRFPNPRAVSMGSAGVITYYSAGAVGTTGGNYVTGVASGVAGVTTAKTATATALGATTADRLGDYVDVAASPGEVLTASAYVARTSGSLTKRVRLRVDYLNASNTVLAGAYDATTAALTDTAPRRLSLSTPAAPAGTTKARVYLWAEGTGTGVAEAFAFQWSAVLLEAGATLRPYFDGATVATDDGDYYYWQGQANNSPSILGSLYVDATTLDGQPRRCRVPLNWIGDAGQATSWYRWTVDGETTVRVQPATAGSTTGPYLNVENDASKPATFPATLVVEARREAAGADVVALAPTVNGTALAGRTLDATWTVYRFPITLKGGTSLNPLNLVRLGKTGAGPVLIRAAAVVDEANYAGDYFDGNSPAVGALASAWTDTREAPNSSSYQGIPSVTVTAVVDPGGATTPPSVTVTVTDADVDNPLREVNVLRVDSGGRRTPVRSQTGGAAELPEVAVGRAVVLHDYEAPYGEPVTYTLEPAAGAYPFPFIPAARVTVDSDRPWLLHPGVPARSRPLSVASLGTRRRRVVEGVYDVVGRGDPITRTDGKRKSAESTLVLRTYTDAEREALDALLDDASPLLLNVPPGRRWGVTYEWVAIGDSDEERTASDGAWPRRLWPLPYRVVGRPVGGTRSARTWHDVANEAASWAELARQHDSWRDVADPTASAG